MTTPTLEEVEAELERRRRASVSSLPNGRASLDDVEAEIARRTQPPVLEQRQNPQSLPWQQMRQGQSAARDPNEGWRPRSLSDLIRERPSREYQTARARMGRYRDVPTADEWRESGVPNWLVPFAQGVSNTNSALEFTRRVPDALGFGDEQAGLTAYVGQGAENLARRSRGQRIEIPASTAADAAIDYARDDYRRFQRERPIQSGLATGSAIIASAGRPAGAIPRLTALQGGATAMALNAPFALARQEGSLQERLPGAAREEAVVGVLGTALQGVANRLGRPPISNSSQARMREFDAAGVRAPLAATQGRGHAPMAQAIAENPVGGNVRRNLQNSVDDVQRASERLTTRAGQAEPREIAGGIVQNAVRRFANGRNEPMPSRQVLNPATGRMQQATARQVPTRDWSFGAKSRALYDDVFGRLAADEQAMIQGGVQSHLSTTATEQALQSITGRVSGTASREAMASPMIQRIQQALGEDVANGTLRFQDLRSWRTWVREAQRNESLRQGIDNAALQRLEGALTEDIYASAMNIGGQAAHDLRAIDRWYRQTTNRINTALQPFDNATGGAQAYRRVIDLASQGGRQNTRQLAQLRASLRPDEWRSVSASIMDELGNPSFGNPHVMEPGAFSLEHFVTNVARMSDEGRQALFGPALARDLENLARVAGYLKGVRSFANMSRSGSSIQNASTIGAAGGAVVAAATGNVAPLTMLVGAGLAARITGEMLTNPAFVRWLTSPGTGGLSRQLQALATIASKDPAVAPLYEELAQHAAGRSRAQEPQPAERSQ